MLDSRADLLRYQRGTLPEHDDLAALTMTRRDLDDQARDARILVDDLTAEQTKVDADVEQVKTRRDRDRTRMDQGLVSNPKDLERMQHEMESLERRITSLEDEELEVMARLEDAQRLLDELTAQRHVPVVEMGREVICDSRRIVEHLRLRDATARAS